ncbi:MAG: cupin domain-containing protein [Minisyncoccia bacterium]
MKKGYVADIEKLSVENENFRQVLYTSGQSQLVIMSLAKGEEIGEEIHDVDQFLRVDKGTGQAVLAGEKYSIKDGSAILVPAGTRHNIINTGLDALKLYSLYMPPHHRDGTVHKTKSDAVKDHEHFDGATTE